MEKYNRFFPLKSLYEHHKKWNKLVLSGVHREVPTLVQHPRPIHRRHGNDNHAWLSA